MKEGRSVGSDEGPDEGSDTHGLRVAVKVGSGSARDLLTSEAFITSLWHADLPFFITLLLDQRCEGDSSDLYYLF